MKIARRCKKKSGTSRKASVMTFRGNKPHVIKKPKYHEGRGKQLKRYGDGWTNIGWEYYQELLVTFRKLKSSDVWKTLQNHWKLYQNKYWNKVDDQAENLSAQGEECEESNEDDWKIDINDGDGNDDIPEETASDDDEEGRPRNRLRIC
jgi:hypothetical protein